MVVCVYRPPGTVTSTFTDQLSDMLDQIILLGNRFVVVGDFNVPGDVAGQLDPHAVDVLTQYGLRQHVTGPTHISGNTLDLILARDERISEQLVFEVAVQSVCFSDHYLLTCRLGVPLPQPAMTTYTYGRCTRSTRQLSASTFCSPGCMVSCSWTPTAMLICSTRRLNESWTSMRRYGQVVVAVASTTAATYRTRRVKPSSSVGDLNVGTVEPGYSQTRRLISRPVQLRVRASSSHEPIT